MPVATSFISPPLGFSIPYHTPHAVSVSLPKWRDNVGYEEGEKRVVDAMQTGYPRFFVHKSIQRLASLADIRLASLQGDKCYLYPTSTIAQVAVSFLATREPPIDGYFMPWTVSSQITTVDTEHKLDDSCTIYAVFTDGDVGFQTQKQYWQHTGDGISSRLAEHCLQILNEEIPGATSLQSTYAASSSTPSISQGPRSAIRGFSRNKHYSRKSSAALEAIMSTPSSSSYSPSSSSAINMSAHDSISSLNNTKTDSNDHVSGAGPAYGDDTTTYIEERYARNLPASQALMAKIALRRRIAGVLNEYSTSQSSVTSVDAVPPPPSATASLIASEDLSICLTSLAADPPNSLQLSNRGVKGLTEDDVFLYPGGMSAIFHAFMTVLAVKNLEHAKREGKRRSEPVLGKSVCFGFPYTDTLKILQKWGPGCYFFGKGLDSCLEDLENLCESHLERYRANPSSENPDDLPILSLFCEFPSNPLLRSPNLARLKKLADKYGFFIVIDETVGGFVNVECLPFADIVVTSLTKIFSGDSNVMGGSLTLNPHGIHYSQLRSALDATYEDTYYSSDAIFMERNSRDFRPRVGKTNKSAESVCTFLAKHTIDTGRAFASFSPTYTDGRVIRPVLKKVFYPKYITPENYCARLRGSNVSTSTSDSSEMISHQAGYGGVFSVTFTSLTASRAFFDALPCCKGPSLGTNFTLACPYTVLAHYLELDWARDFEVEEGLVRVSIGLENEEMLREWFGKALQEAELAEADDRRSQGT